MKIKYLLPICFILLLLSCKKETPETTPQTERPIKRKLFFNSHEETTARYILDYEYDLDNRLVRTIGSSERIDSFKYNSIHQLVKKLGYENNYHHGYYLVDSVNYQFKGVLLMKELICDLWNGNLRSLNRYVYENSKLTEKYAYYNQKFVSYTRYEYSGDDCTKETCFTDSLGSNISIYQDHHYKNKKLIGTETYGFNGSKIQLINYTYNVEGNLITEEAKLTTPDAAKPYFYVYRYEYD